jgi:hypothetical protein
MVYYDTDIRLQLAREHADRLASEMRRQRLNEDEAGYPRLARLGSALAGASKPAQAQGAATPRRVTRDTAARGDQHRSRGAGSCQVVLLRGGGHR